MVSDMPIPQEGWDDGERRLDELFQAYRASCLTPEPGVNFMPELWQKIEARERSTNLFGRMAKALVTAAVVASVALGMLISATNYQSNTYFNGTYIDALSADRASDLEPMQADRTSEMEH